MCMNAMRQRTRDVQLVAQFQWWELRVDALDQLLATLTIVSEPQIYLMLEENDEIVEGDSSIGRNFPPIHDI